MRDRHIAMGVFCLGLTVGMLVMVETKVGWFYQFFMREVVMWSCGLGLLDPVQQPAELVDFVFNRRVDLPCSALAAVTETRPVGMHTLMQPYLSAAIGAHWRLFGVTYSSLFPLFGLFYAAYGVAAYSLSRQFFGKAASLGVAVAVLLSPVSMHMLPYLRDFSKAPFFLGTMALLLVAIRAQTQRNTVFACAAAGALIGLGFGFRPDIMILAPTAVLVLVIGLNNGAGWRGRVAGICALLAATALISTPVLVAGKGMGGGGGFGAMAMQGSTDPFARYMGLGAAPYSLGWQYSDELTYSTVAADLRRTLPDWDRNEGVPTQSMTQAYTRSTQYFLQWAPLFAGDYATRALKSALWIAGFGQLALPEQQMLDPGGPHFSRHWLASVLTPLTLLLSGTWMPWIGALGLIALLFQTFVQSTRLALAVAVLFGAVLAYPVVQFSMRHVFHLEVLRWMALAALAAVAVEWKTHRPLLGRFALVVAACVGVIALTRGGLIVLQDRWLRAEIASLLAKPREPMALSAPERTDTEAIYTIAVPAPHRALVAGQPDSLNKFLTSLGHPHSTASDAVRLLVNLGGADCVPGTFSLKFKYDKRPLVWQPMDHALTVSVPANPSARSLVIAPAFYRATQNFAGFAVPLGRERCIAGVEQIPMGLPGLPIAFNIALPPDWQNLWFAQTFGTFDVGKPLGR